MIHLHELRQPDTGGCSGWNSSPSSSPSRDSDADELPQPCQKGDQLAEQDSWHASPIRSRHWFGAVRPVSFEALPLFTPALGCFNSPVSLNHVLALFAALGALAILLGALVPGRQRQVPHMVVSGIILVIAGVCYWLNPDIAGYASSGAYVVLLLLPGTLGWRASKHALAQRYDKAATWSRWLNRCFPYLGWQRTAELFHGLDLAWKDQIEAAEKVFTRLADGSSIDGRSATCNLFRLRNQWPELRAWLEQREAAGALERDPSLVTLWLRALGECGDPGALMRAFARYEKTIHQPGLGFLHDLCRLYVLGFAGRVERAERLCSTTLQPLPFAVRELWIGTAEFATGNREAAVKRFESIRDAADGFTRLSIAWRLRPDAPPAPALTDNELAVVARVEKELEAEERIGTRPGTLVRRRRITYVLLALNVAIFIAAAFSETSEGNPWFALGVLDTWAIREGQWWRLLTSTFLHADGVHLFLNMIGLGLLGPFIETNLPRFRYLTLYFASGICSMLFVHLLHRNDESPYFALGASGAIMGLVGAAGAVFLHAWLRERARPLLTALRRVVLVMAVQIIFDLLTPRVSSAAHVSGFVIGFWVAFALIVLNRKPRS